MSLYIQITDKCNMRCDHCALSCTGKGTFMTQEVFDKCLEIAKEHPSTIAIGGGEPTLHPKCLEWVMQAALALVDVSLEYEFPAVFIVTNGKKTEMALKLAKMAHLGIIAAEVSQDMYHDAIDPKVVKEFTRYKNRSKWDYDVQAKGFAGVRNVEGGIKNQGRAKETGTGEMGGCACSSLFIEPNGDFYWCGCRKEKLGNILTDEIPEAYWEQPGECVEDVCELTAASK